MKRDMVGGVIRKNRQSGCEAGLFDPAKAVWAA
jgi:hypothetical protein